MLKYFDDGTLQVDTLDLPQECGEVKVCLEVENEMDDCNLYLDFRCSKNVKFISQKLTKIGTKMYEVVLPSGISSYIGEVYVQLVIVKKDTSTLLSRSLIGRNPIFVIKESILASQTLESKDKHDFLEQVSTTLTEVEKKLDNVQNFAKQLKEEVEKDCNDAISNCSDTILNVNATLNEWKEQVQAGKFDGVSLEYCGEWKIGTMYYSGIGNEKKISIVKVETEESIKGYICLKSGKATTTNSPLVNEMSWSEFFNIDISKKFDKACVKNTLDTTNSNVYSSAFLNNLFDKKIDKESIAINMSDTSNKIPTINSINQVLNKKVDILSIAQNSGSEQEMIMSQKAVTDFVNKKVKVTPISNNGKLTSLSFADTKVDTLIIIALAGGNCEFKLIDGENKALYSHWDPAFIFIEVTAGGSKYTAIFYDGTIKTDYTNIAKHTYRFSSIVGTIYEISRGEL